MSDKRIINIFIRRISNIWRSFLSKKENLTILSYFFLVLEPLLYFMAFEFAFYILVIRMSHAYLYEMWILQAIVVVGYVIYLYSLRSRILRILTSITLLILKSLFLALLIFWFQALVTIKIILSLLMLSNVLSLILSIKVKSENLAKINIQSMALIFLIFTSTTVYTYLPNNFLPSSIEISPKSEPELVFFCSSSQLPDDEEILDMCNKYNIAFMPTIRRSTVGDDEYMQLYKNIIEHEINLYFCMGGDDEFFAHIDNAEEFPSIYDEIRDWFLDEEILDSEYLTSFCVDAEPPRDYDKNMEREDIQGSVEYGVDNYPKKEEIKEATNAMEKLIDLIKEDGKEAGMIRAAQLLDSADKDSDLSLFTRNVHTLEVKWDFTITMLYRTNTFQEDDSRATLFMAASLSNLFGTIIEGTSFTNSELSFYQGVALEQTSGDTYADDKFIFVGDFSKEFEDTQYIKNKEFLKDLDICRHFEQKKVFLYDLKGFLHHYGWEGIRELGCYNRKREAWTLKYNTGSSIAFYAFYCVLIIVDIFAFFERDLT